MNNPNDYEVNGTFLKYFGNLIKIMITLVLLPQDENLISFPIIDYGLEAKTSLAEGVHL